MKDSKSILDLIKNGTFPSQKNSPTDGIFRETPLTSQQKEELVDVINLSFGLLRTNYHHLYFSAFKERDAEDSAKRLWLHSLASFQPSVILNAMDRIIKKSDYLPTLSQVIRICTELKHDFTLPSAHSAYVEACRAASPKRNAKWSHVAVYYAGREVGWNFLASSPENKAY